MQSDGLGIHLKVRDIQVSREFYERTLGLVPVFGYGDREFRLTLPESIASVTDDGLPGAPEQYSGVTYELTPQSPLEIADGHVAVPDADVFDRPVESAKVSAMVRVDSVAGLLARGLNPKFPIRSYYWGTIELAIKDPDGLVLIFIAPFSEAELAAVREHREVEVVAAPNS